METTILKAPKTDRDRWNNTKVTQGNIIKKGKCEFICFSVIAGKIDIVRDAYCKLKLKYGNARHIVCAYRLPGSNWPLLQDYQDNEEYNAGSFLLKMLQDAEIFNRAMFVVRFYGGEHLGPSRFQAFTEATQSAITHSPFNYISKCTQTPWPKNATVTSKPCHMDKPKNGSSTSARGRLGGHQQCKLSGPHRSFSNREPFLEDAWDSSQESWAEADEPDTLLPVTDQVTTDINALTRAWSNPELLSTPTSNTNTEP